MVRRVRRPEGAPVDGAEPADSGAVWCSYFTGADVERNRSTGSDGGRLGGAQDGSVLGARQEGPAEPEGQHQDELPEAGNAASGMAGV